MSGDNFIQGVFIQYRLDFIGAAWKDMNACDWIVHTVGERYKIQLELNFLH